jgi:hypothetical protein
LILLSQVLDPALGKVEGQDLSRISPPELGAELVDTQGAIDRLEAHQLRALALFSRAKGYTEDGFPDAVSWLKAHARMSGGAASERVQVGQKLENLPLMSEALSSGAIGFQQAAVISRALGEVSPSQAAQLEERAVTAALLPAS